MEKSMQLRLTIEEYAIASPRVRIWHIIQPKWNDAKKTGNEICEACARLAAENVQGGVPNPQVEIRLRKLVAIIRSMQEVGLIE